MFWSKPKKDLPVVDLSGKYVYNTDILSIRKVDEIDLEFIRRNEPMVYERMMTNGADDNYYIVRDSSKQGWKIINQHVLDNEYTKLGE